MGDSIENEEVIVVGGQHCCYCCCCYSCFTTAISYVICRRAISTQQHIFVVDRGDYLALSEALRELGALRVRDPHKFVNTTSEALEEGIAKVQVRDGSRHKIEALDFSRVSIVGAANPWLPESLGELDALRVVNLEGFAIAGVSPTVLRGWTNVRDLDLSYTTSLGNLPNEMGSLVQLERLSLRRPTNGSMTTLPDWIRNLTNLKCLDVSFTDIRSLPSPQWFQRLENLEVLKLTGTPLLRDGGRSPAARSKPDDGSLSLWDLVHGKFCPKLGCLGLQDWQTRNYSFHQGLSAGLSWNRARYRLLKATATPSEMLSWPAILSSGPRWFAPYPTCTKRLHSSSTSCCDCRRPVEQKDAVYRLISTFGPGNG